MECGVCKLCCKLLQLTEVPSKIGEWCRYCDQTKINGCLIQINKPEECKIYQCMWSQMENVGIELRPDKSHIIFDKISDKTICSRQDSDYKMKQLVRRQIKEFNKQGYSVIVLIDKKKYFSLTDGHTLKEVRRDLDDRTKLHRRLD